MSTIRKEGVVIIAGKRRLNSIQFNAIAIFFVLAVLPFSVAIISTLGDSTTTKWNDSMNTTTPLGEPITNSYWDTNGGNNYTEFYDQTFGTGSSQPLSPSLIDCSYIVDTTCRGLGLNGSPKTADWYKGNDMALPMTSTPMFQSHKYPNYAISPSQEVYYGQSGAGEFSWIMDNQYFKNLEDDTSLDAIAFTMVDRSVLYLNLSSFASDIGFNACVTFIYQNDTLEYCSVYESDNGYCYDYYTGTVHMFQCFVGLEIEFDFTSFETLEIAEFNGGNWTGTEIKVSFEEFYREDGQDFGSTPLPFAGSSSFDFGIEHKEVNAKETGFLIKGGTLLLSFVIFVFAIASTPYWDPFKQAFRGVQ